MLADVSLLVFRYVRSSLIHRHQYLIATTGRNQDYLTLSIIFTKDIGKARQLINCFPSFLRSLAAKTLTNVDRRIEECRRFIEPIVLERMALMDKLGDQWDDKPVGRWKNCIYTFPTDLIVERHASMDHR